MMSNKEQTIKDDKENGANAFVSITLTTFATVFIAELGDKTQIATLLLSAHSGRPITVFFGAALALLATSLVGVLIGRWLSRVIPTDKFDLIAGGLMVSIGIFLALETLKSNPL